MSRMALVVDDSMVIRHTISRFLEERGFIIEAAINGRQALQLIATLRPDLIVTDLEMPEMTGGELIRELKARPETADIPIIILTGNHNGAATAGTEAEVVIYKDIDIEEQLEKAIAALS